MPGTNCDMASLDASSLKAIRRSNAVEFSLAAMASNFKAAMFCCDATAADTPSGDFL